LVQGEQSMMNEIYNNGPIVVTVDLYEDFLVYKSGVYKHQIGNNIGGHAMNIYGWGVEDGQKYW